MKRHLSESLSVCVHMYKVINGRKIWGCSSLYNTCPACTRPGIQCPAPLLPAHVRETGDEVRTLVHRWWKHRIEQPLQTAVWRLLQRSILSHRGLQQSLLAKPRTRTRTQTLVPHVTVALLSIAKTSTPVSVSRGMDMENVLWAS